ncbi:MAG: hypothetical protein MUE41_04445 [Gemmatimonadaceae bacterium]|nr:hypothetical protein [Gemmatimonadaceae bacterium]
MADDRVGNPDPAPPPRATPYGPATPRIRRFLQRAAALNDVSWGEVRARHAATSTTPVARRADRALGAAIDQGGLLAERDAVVGPIVQLAQRVTVADADVFDTTAEALLGAALALMAGDLLAVNARDALYAPFADVIPLAELDG